MRQIKRPAAGDPGYPDRDGFANPACDADRRRFLRQITLGAGALTVGIPKMGQSQDLTVNLDKLERHTPVSTELQYPGLQTLSDTSMAAEMEEDQAPRADDALADVAAAPPGILQEDRALWVEPGYLVLLRWSRPADDNTPVAALEASADAVQQFLTSRITQTDQVHNIDLLHPIEYELATFLEARVAPASIDVLHLDHDCRVVCSGLNPGTHYPEVIEVMGDIPAPGWE